MNHDDAMKVVKVVGDQPRSKDPKHLLTINLDPMSFQITIW
jgi:hypothetical protein